MECCIIRMQSHQSLSPQRNPSFPCIDCSVAVGCKNSWGKGPCIIMIHVIQVQGCVQICTYQWGRLIFILVTVDLSSQTSPLSWEWTFDFGLFFNIPLLFSCCVWQAYISFHIICSSINYFPRLKKHMNTFMINFTECSYNQLLVQDTLRSIKHFIKCFW